MSKRQSPTTVLFRTTFTRTITLYELLIRHGCPRIDKKTQLLTGKVLHGCSRRLRPPVLKLFCTQSSHGKMVKAASWTLEIISYWSAEKLSSKYYLSLDRRKLYLPNSAQKSGDICPTSHVVESLRVLASHVLESLRVLASHVPESPRPPSPTYLFRN